MWQTRNSYLDYPSNKYNLFKRMSRGLRVASTYFLGKSLDKLVLCVTIQAELRKTTISNSISYQ